eukprot:TRINITY_DN4418_c0_g1_i3.p1 TRINITY_DN4418_c0_g1~~TRINITY_DN4418_c0_g1_i3.p1  ORF type:complete len:324 (+),score=52.43 TRINITY_DN4418_c0_g1_i3:57-1028(+)
MDIQENRNMTLLLDGLLAPPRAAPKVTSKKAVGKKPRCVLLPFEFSAEFIRSVKSGRHPVTQKQAGSEGATEPVSISSSRLLAEMDPWPPGTTTVLLRNIPHRCVAEEVLEEVVDRGFEGTFDFFYLPIDFKNKRHKGYAFINLLNDSLANRFRVVFHGQTFKRHKSQKVLDLSAGTTQGFEANAQQFLRSRLDRVSNPWFKPQIFIPGASSGDLWQCLPLSAENLLRRVQQHRTPYSDHKPVRPPPGLEHMRPGLALSQGLVQQESELAEGVDLKIAATIEEAVRHFLQSAAMEAVTQHVSHSCINRSMPDVEKQRGRALSQ